MQTFLLVSTLAAGLFVGTAVSQQTPPNAPSATKTDQTQAANPNGLNTQKDKFSYALGMNVGNNLRKQAVPVDPDLLMRGLKDALAGGNTALSEEEMRSTLTEMQSELRKQMQEKAKAEGEANKKEGDAFLAANKGKEGVVVLPSGLQYKILKAGTGPKPVATDSVVCNYTGTLINGKEFDSSAKHGGPATFPVNGVIKGWTEALQLMPTGSKWQLFVPSDLAYAERGAGADIGPNATLTFEVELVSIQPKAEEKKPEEKK
jgi:FKBP-type peptidyl-prolyl cis-trans isomerase